MKQHIGHANTLTVSSRKLADGLMLHISNGAVINDFFYSITSFRSFHAAHLGKKIQQCHGGHLGIERAILREVPNAVGNGQPISGYILTADTRHTGTGSEKPRKQLHGRALACSVWPEKSHHLALGNGEV